MSTFVEHKQRCNTTVLPHECQTERSDIPLCADLLIPNISAEQRKCTANPTCFSLLLPEYFWELSSQCRVKSCVTLTSYKVLIWWTVFPGSRVCIRRIMARGLRAVGSWAVLNASSFAKSPPPKCSLTSFHTSKHRFCAGMVSAFTTHEEWHRTGCTGISVGCAYYNTLFISCHTDPTYLYSNWIRGMTTYLKDITTMMLGGFSIWNYCFKGY